MTASASMLKAAFKAVATQMDAVKIFPSEEGWRIYARSTDNVSMADVRIPASAFSAYEVWEPIVVDTRDLLEPLSKAKDDATIDISGGRLVIRAGGLRFTRGLMADLEVTPRMPELVFESECIVPMQALEPLLSAPVDKIAFKTLTMSTAGGSLSIEVAESDSDLGAVALSVPGADCVLIDGEATSGYPAGCLFDILRSVPQGTEADISLRDDFPLQIAYSAGGAEIRFFVAPRIPVEGP